MKFFGARFVFNASQCCLSAHNPYLSIELSVIPHRDYRSAQTAARHPADPESYSTGRTTGRRIGAWKSFASASAAVRCVNCLSKDIESLTNHCFIQAKAKATRVQIKKERAEENVATSRAVKRGWESSCGGTTW